MRQDHSSGVAAFAPPASLQAGLTGTLDLVFTATDTIATGAAIRVVDPGFNGRFWDLVTPGDASAASTNPSVELALFVDGVLPLRPSYVTTKVSSGELVAGDEVTLTMDNVLAPVKAYQHVEAPTLTDADGDGTFAPIATYPRLDILPDPTPDLVGVPFILTVRVLDKYGNASVDFACESAKADQWHYNVDSLLALGND